MSGVDSVREPDGVNEPQHRVVLPPGVVARHPVGRGPARPTPTVNRDEQAEVTVPNVLGMRAEEAATLLNQVALHYAAPAPLDGVHVSDQDPRPGSTARAGDTVRLLLSES